MTAVLAVKAVLAAKVAKIVGHAGQYSRIRPGE
jgi:hypothetical protein